MNAREAIDRLIKVGFTPKQGRGSHVIMSKNGHVLVVPVGSGELSYGMTKKVRTFEKK